MRVFLRKMLGTRFGSVVISDSRDLIFSTISLKKQNVLEKIVSDLATLARMHHQIVMS